MGGRVTHGQTRQKHGKKDRSGSYRSWEAMIQRCLDPNAHMFPKYDAIGITVCDRWRTFENFYADMGDRPEKHSLDRFPNQSGNYEPGNCRWATSTEQNNNRSGNFPITAFGQTLNHKQWAKKLNINRATISKRLDLGCGPERALSEPIRYWRNGKAAYYKPGEAIEEKYIRQQPKFVRDGLMKRVSQ